MLPHPMFLLQDAKHDLRARRTGGMGAGQGAFRRAMASCPPPWRGDGDGRRRKMAGHVRGEEGRGGGGCGDGWNVRDWRQGRRDNDGYGNRPRQSRWRRQGRSVLGGRRWESSFSLSFSVGACGEGNGPTCRRIVLCTIACGRAANVRSESNG
jgi:hypothetical protein